LSNVKSATTRLRLSSPRAIGSVPALNSLPDHRGSFPGVKRSGGDVVLASTNPPSSSQSHAVQSHAVSAFQ
jgi:hypothetical protein